MLAYADHLLGSMRPLSTRLLPFSWNASSGVSLKTRSAQSFVADLQTENRLQQVLNALQVAGFVTWLRNTPDQDLHILAIPLADSSILQSAWAPYIQAYWQSRILCHLRFFGDRGVEAAAL